MSLALLCQSLCQPHTTQALDLTEWDALIRLCRAGNLLARLAQVLSDEGLLESVPTAPRAHLQAERVLCERQAVAVRFEVARLEEALAPIGVPLTLLKGAAYLASGHAASAGRLFSDIDILVPRERLDAVESALMQHGWHSLPLSPYDKRYYRQWMHELPPMQHRTRGTALDVHHTLVPPTTGLAISGAALLADAKPSAIPGVWVLSDIDQVLHSACHWFYESEYQNGLRDCLDVVSLIRSFEDQDAFWARLIARAQGFHLLPALGRVLAVCEETLQLALPPFMHSALSAHIKRGSWLRWLHTCALAPGHPLCEPRFAGLGRLALLCRGHALRMPPALLAMHLGRKLWQNRTLG
ncbi:MAG: hypothetical protein RIR70_787 [Pseudomonadota bacterium]|jgi:hypothetical protein